MARFAVALPPFLLAASLALGQNPPASDPQALTFAAQSIAAMTGGATISDVTLAGNAVRIAGSDKEVGTVTLMGRGTGESRVDMDFKSSMRSDIRNDNSGDFPQGASVLNGGKPQPWPLHNCLTSPNWFFPELSPLVNRSDQTLTLSYVGQETKQGHSVQHLRTSRYVLRKPRIQAITQQLSITDYYLDSQTFLPLAMIFNFHPDDDAGTNIMLEIDFSNYQNINGIQVPIHIQKLISGGLAMDISISSAVFNNGLPDYLFTVQ